MGFVHVVLRLRLPTDPGCRALWEDWALVKELALGLGFRV